MRTANCACLIIAALTASVTAQTLTIVPERVLYSDMEVATVGPFVSQAAAGTGVVWSRIITHPTGVPAVRVHIQVRQGRPAADWANPLPGPVRTGSGVLRWRVAASGRGRRLEPGDPGPWGRNRARHRHQCAGTGDCHRSLRVPRHLADSAGHHRPRSAHSDSRRSSGGSRLGQPDREASLHQGRGRGTSARGSCCRRTCC